MNRKFELMELVIVVAIIAIIAAIAIPSLIRARRIGELKEQGVEVGKALVVNGVSVVVLEFDFINDEGKRLKCRTPDNREVWYFLKELGFGRPEVGGTVEIRIETGTEVLGSEF